MATKKKTYQPGDVYHNIVGRDRREIELVGAPYTHIVTVTEGQGTYGERGIEVVVNEDYSSAGLTVQLSREQATELFDALAEMLNIDYTGIDDAL